VHKETGRANRNNDFFPYFCQKTSKMKPKRPFALPTVTRAFWPLLLALLAAGCGQPQPETPQPETPAPADAVVLVFVKEARAEAYANGQFKGAFAFLPARPPLGKFAIRHLENGQLAIDFPGRFDQRKARADKSLFQEDRDRTLLLAEDGQERLAPLLGPESYLLIFPNDARATGSFDPCGNCPHWMSELYSYLWLQLENYKKEDQNI
jgi:hypothetical protein